MQRNEWLSPARRGFTLIELLIVITIISLLIAILLPALAGAREQGKMIREMSAGKQQITGWDNYTTDYKGGVTVPYIHWSWAHPQNPLGAISVFPYDERDATRFLEGDVIKTWPWRFAFYTQMPMNALQIDKGTFQMFDARTAGPPTQTTQWANTYDNTSYRQYAMAWHPTFGMNSVFVGGHYLRGAFVRGNKDFPGHPLPGTQGGQFYVTKIEDIRQPSMLMVMTSARSVDVATASSGGSINYGGVPVPYVAGRPIVPGYYEVTPPRIGGLTSVLRPGAQIANWVAGNKFQKNSNPRDWGFVDFRYGERAVSAMADGSARLFSPEGLRDMRHWSNKATSPTWTFSVQDR